MSTHTLCLLLAALGGACELLAAFGLGGIGPVALLPLGMVFLFGVLALHHHPH